MLGSLYNAVNKPFEKQAATAVIVSGMGALATGITYTVRTLTGQTHAINQTNYPPSEALEQFNGEITPYPTCSSEDTINGMLLGASVALGGLITIILLQKAASRSSCECNRAHYQEIQS